MKRLILRADDLGYCEGANIGIAKSVKEGCIRSVGVMANLETAQQGIQLLKDSDVVLGLHCNISAGYPLTKCEKIASLVDENGRFKKSASYMKDGNDIVDFDEVLQEIEAQYNQFLKLTGKKPAYMDGHAVASKHFFAAIEQVAHMHDVLYSPLPISEKEPIQIGNTMVYMHAGTSLNISPEDTLHQIVEDMREDECHMIVYHPGFIDAYMIENSSLTTHRVFETRMLCDSSIVAYVKEQVDSITYEDL